MVALLSIGEVSKLAGVLVLTQLTETDKNTDKKIIRPIIFMTIPPAYHIAIELNYNMN